MVSKAAQAWIDEHPDWDQPKKEKVKKKPKKKPKKEA